MFSAGKRVSSPLTRYCSSAHSSIAVVQLCPTPILHTEPTRLNHHDQWCSTNIQAPNTCSLSGPPTHFNISIVMPVELTELLSKHMHV